MTMLILSLVALGLGPLLHRLANSRDWLRFALDGFVLVAVGGLVLLHILPETVEKAGWLALVFVAIGILSPVVFERWLTTRARQAHAAAVVFGLSGLVLHNIIDGIGLVLPETGHEDHAHEHSLLSWAIVVHQIPVGLMVWWFLKPLHGPTLALAFLCLLGGATVCGFFFGETLQSGLENNTVLWLQALVAGSLLHVVMHRSHDHLGVERTPWKIPAGLGALAGIGLLYFLDSQGDVHQHHHQHGGLEHFSETFLALALESAPALVLAYLVAGLIQVFLPASSTRWMSRGGTLSQAIRGVVFGLPLPICSCGVVPIYRSLMYQHVPAAAALAFLIATPELGVDALLLSFGLLGRDMALIRLVSAGFVAVVIAALLARFARKLYKTPLTMVEGGAPAPVGRARWIHALKVGAFDLVDTTGPWVVFGIAVAAVIAPTVDAERLAAIPNLLQVPVFALIGMPMYVCASGATPLVAVLLDKGVSPGAAIAFLLTGPATNVTTFGLLSRFHGRPFALAFAGGMFLVTVLVGCLVNLLPIEVVPFKVDTHEHHASGWFNVSCGAILAGLLVLSVLRQGPRGFIGQIFALAQLDPGAERHEHGDGHHHGPPGDEKPSCCS